MSEVECLRQQLEVSRTANKIYSAMCDKRRNEVEALTAALQQIADMGPMSVDDQRWRIAREALGIIGNAPSV